MKQNEKYEDFDKAMSRKIMNEFKGKAIDHVCPYCKGTKTTINGKLPCDECKGTGTLKYVW